MANENAERTILAGRGISAPSTNPNSRGILYKVELRDIATISNFLLLRSTAMMIIFPETPTPLTRIALHATDVLNKPSFATSLVGYPDEVRR